MIRGHIIFFSFLSGNLKHTVPAISGKYNVQRYC